MHFPEYQILSLLECLVYSLAYMSKKSINYHNFYPTNIFYNNGSFKILNHHAPMVASLKQGIVKVDTANGTEQFPIKGGVVECGDKKVVVLA